MQISVNKDGYRYKSIRIPNFLFINRLAAWLICRKCDNVTYRQIWSFMRAFKKFCRKNKKWKLVEVRYSKGEKVEIII